MARPSATLPLRWPAALSLVLPLLVATTREARAQDIEPRSYSNAPIGTNFFIGGYAFTRGALSTDPSIPLTNSRLQTSSVAIAYAHAFDFFGMSAKVDLIAPYNWLSGTATLAGQPISRDVSGLSDPRLRVSVNFIGAPALTAEQFASYRQDLIVGASLQVSMPMGQYDSTRVVNLGTNRWFVKPEIGISQAFGPLTLEGMAAVTLFTHNGNFYGGSTRAQAPLYAFQAHAIYSFGRGLWASADATYFAGGRTSINGEANDDTLRNWRVGATVAAPLSSRASLRFYASRGVYARTGNNFDLIGIALQYRWGGGN